MERTEKLRREDPALRANICPAEGSDKPEIEPESWRDLTDFVDQFSELAVFGILANTDDCHEEFWIVRDISKVRPSAVPIDQAPTFEMEAFDSEGKVTHEVRFIIDEIERVQAADPADED